jgi:hypothetical protein
MHCCVTTEHDCTVSSYIIQSLTYKKRGTPALNSLKIARKQGDLRSEMPPPYTEID